MKISRSVRVGLFVAAGAAALVGVALFLGHTRAVFASKMELIAEFTNTNGLVVGSPVRLAGVGVGQVEDIHFGADPAAGKVIVELSVDEEYAERIRADSIAEMAPMGLLGDMLINISLGSPNAPPINDGDKLRTRDTKGLNELMVTVERAVDNVERITDVLDKRLERVLTATLADDLGRLAKASADIAEGIAEGPGLAHALIYDPRLEREASALLAEARGTAARIHQSAGNAQRILEQVERGDGLVHGLIYGSGGTELLGELRAIARDLDAVIREVKDGNGILHSLIYEKEDANLLENLSIASQTLREIVTDIDEGKGTLGGFLRDPSIYRDVKGILGEVRRNTILKALVRMTIKRDDLVRPDTRPVPPRTPPPDRLRPPDEEEPEDGASAALREEQRPRR